MAKWGVAAPKASEGDATDADVADVPSEGMMAPAMSKSSGMSRAGLPKAESKAEGKAEVSAQPKGVAPKSAAPKSLALGASQPKRAPMPVESSAPKRKLWEEDGLSNDDLSAAISSCKTYGIDYELQSLAKKITPTQAYRSAVGRCIGQLRGASLKTASALKHTSGIVLVEACGSHSQGTDIDASDTEVAVRISSKLSQEERDSFVESVREQLQTSPFSNHVEVTEGMRLYQHMSSPMSIELKSTVPRMVAHVLVFGQPPKPIEKALSVDDVIKQLCDTCTLSRDVVRLVKLWATNNGLANQDGHLSTLAWTLLIIFFFQTEGLMPSYVRLVEEKAPHPPTKLRLSELLRGFFMFLAKRPAPPALQGISVTMAEEISPASGCLYVEDPAEFHTNRTHRNLAENVGEAQWSQVIAEAKKAADRLTARPQRWFHWGELFHPREQPLEKMQKIEPLKEAVASLTSSAGESPLEQAAEGHPASDGHTATAASELLGAHGVGSLAKGAAPGGPNGLGGRAAKVQGILTGAWAPRGPVAAPPGRRDRL